MLGKRLGLTLSELMVLFAFVLSKIAGALADLDGVPSKVVGTRPHGQAARATFFACYVRAVFCLLTGETAKRALGGLGGIGCWLFGGYCFPTGASRT